MSTHSVMIVAGEASGEQHGAELVHALKKDYPADWHFFGAGGRCMRQAGVEIEVDCADLAVMGFGDVVKHLPSLWRSYQRLKACLRERRPSLLVLIDYPGLNLKLAKFAKSLGIKVLFYISPQVWAWRQHRVKKIAQRVDHLAVIFPFEVDFYRQVQLPVTYVGHPLTQVVRASGSPEEIKTRLHIPSGIPVVGLLPGSRQTEIRRLLPTLLSAAEKIQATLPQTRFLLPLASTIERSFLESYLHQSALSIQIVENQTYDVMQACDAVMIASGTATLEAALLKKPMVIVYKAPALAAFLLKRLIKIPYIGLANIVAERQIMPELLQEKANGDEISQAILKMLMDEPYRQTLIQALKEIPQKLGSLNGSENVAKLVMTFYN